MTFEYPDGQDLPGLKHWLKLRLIDAWPELSAAVESQSDGKIASEALEAARRLDPLELWRKHWSKDEPHLCEGGPRLGLNDHDMLLITATRLLADEPELESMRRRAINDNTFFEARLVIRLLAQSSDAWPVWMERLSPQAPLCRFGLVHLDPLGTLRHSAHHRRLLGLDEATFALVQGREHWPSNLDLCVDRHQPHGVVSPGGFLADKQARLQRALAGIPNQQGPRVVALTSASIESARTLALKHASSQQRSLFELHLSRALRPDLGHGGLDALVPLLARELRLHDALLLVDLGRSATGKLPPLSDDVLFALARLANLAQSALILDLPVGGDERIRRYFEGYFEVRILPPTLDEQVALWQDALNTYHLTPISERVLRVQVCDLAVELGDIEQAARLTSANSWLMGDADDVTKPREVTAEQLRAVITSSLNKGLQGIAERVTTTFAWKDLILPDKVLSALMEILTFARYRRKVFDEWGFGAKLPYGKANSCLFTGPPGTGKTMAAGVIARDLGMDLFRVDLSQVMSKWVGETEKNLARIFDEASRGHALLLFDEADSLFAKRTEVKTSNDHHNNLQVNYLLQRIETFEGVAVLTTNLADSIDDAFERRIKLRVEFPMPDAKTRAVLWSSLLPKGDQVDPNIDFARLGECFEIAGGHIKNAVMRAAFNAAEAGTPITTMLLEQAGISEMRGMGKLVRVDGQGHVMLSKDKNSRVKQTNGEEHTHG